MRAHASPHVSIRGIWTAKPEVLKSPGARRMGRDLRIAFIGDSFVNGTGDPEVLGWTGRVCARVHPGQPSVTHYNLGIRRNTSADVRARWRSEAELRLPPGVDARLVFSFGVNDVIIDDGHRRLELGDSIENFRAVVESASSQWPVLVVGPPPVWLADQPAIGERIGELSEAFSRVSSAYRIPYLDAFSPLSSSAHWREQLAAGDGAHPAASGYAVLADLVSAWGAWRSWLDAA